MGEAKLGMLQLGMECSAIWGHGWLPKGGVLEKMSNELLKLKSQSRVSSLTERCVGPLCHLLGW